MPPGCGPAAGSVPQDSSVLEAELRDADRHVCTFRPSDPAACGPREAADGCPGDRLPRGPPPGTLPRVAGCLVRTEPGWEAERTLVA